MAFALAVRQPALARLLSWPQLSNTPWQQQRSPGHSMFKKIRILIWLYILVLVAGGTWLTSERSTDWNDPLWLVVYPIAGDHSPSTKKFVGALKENDFQDVEVFFKRQGKRYGLAIKTPVVVKLAQPLVEGPPPPPKEPGVLGIMAWSLHMRYWAWSAAREQSDLPADIRMFVTFHDPKKHSGGHDSLAIREGLIGIVNAFASKRHLRRNNVIIAHETLHTVGATDKYDFSSNLPIFPEGYAEPDASPRYPQRLAEIMGGRRPVSANSAAMPKSLKKVVVGATTALEIRWTQ
jgi:hypothetical protein